MGGGRLQRWVVRGEERMPVSGLDEVGESAERGGEESGTKM